MSVSGVLEKTLFVPAAAAASSEVANLLEGKVDVVNIAIVVLLGTVAYFLQRLIRKLDNVCNKVDAVDHRLVVLETKHEGASCLYTRVKAEEAVRQSRRERQDG